MNNVMICRNIQEHKPNTLLISIVILIFVEKSVMPLVLARPPQGSDLVVLEASMPQHLVLE